MSTPELQLLHDSIRQLQTAVTTVMENTTALGEHLTHVSQTAGMSSRSANIFIPVLRAIIRSHPDPIAMRDAWAAECALLLQARGLNQAEIGQLTDPQQTLADDQNQEERAQLLAQWTAWINTLTTR